MITVGKAAALAAAIADKQAAVNAYEAQLIEAGMNWQGNVIQVDSDSQRYMLTVQTAYLLGQTNPSGGAWRSKANVMVPMTDDQVKAMILAAQTYVTGILDSGWKNKDAIGKLTTLAAVAAYDITTGWPSNNH